MRKLFDLLKLTGGKLQFLVLIMLRCPFDTLYTLNMARFLQKGFEFVQMGNEQGIFHACFWFGFASLLLFCIMEPYGYGMQYLRPIWREGFVKLCLKR